MAILDRKYVYKVSRGGAYLGELPNVISEFGYSQELNSASTEMIIEVAQSLATADEAPVPILTETGEPILTEDGTPITTERSVEIIGGKNSGRIIANNNDVDVYEISDDNPNGLLVFSGYMSRWSGRSNGEDTISITVISDGKDLDDYIIGTGTFSLQFSQTTFDTVGAFLGATVHRPDQPHPESPYSGQSFSGLSFVLSKISLDMALGEYYSGITPTTADVTLRLYSGTPDSGLALLSTVTVTLTNQTPDYEEIEFILPEPILLSSSSAYFFYLSATDFVSYRATSFDHSVYAGGQEYFSDDAVAWTSYNPSFFTSTGDFVFRLYSGGSATDAEFVAVDPSDIARDSLDIYSGQGGVVSYSAATIEDTDTAVDYTFRMATMLEVINKVLELAPSDWYWYVDVATQLLTLKPVATTATHKFIIGRHLESFEYEATVEEIVNVVYFSGGPTAGVNLLKKYTNAESLADNRIGMQRLNDNRVTDEPTAQILSENLIEETTDEIFRARSIVINADTYDITSIHLGETVGFSGAGNFIEDLVFQITNTQRSAYFIRLTLGKLPLRANNYVQQIKRDLNNQQTLENPDQPA